VLSGSRIETLRGGSKQNPMITTVFAITRRSSEGLGACHPRKANNSSIAITARIPSAG